MLLLHTPPGSSSSSIQTQTHEYSSSSSQETAKSRKTSNCHNNENPKFEDGSCLQIHHVTKQIAFERKKKNKGQLVYMDLSYVGSIVVVLKIERKKK
ncbi:hypothetical protein MTR_0302s0040 [Medicago truncatula]|uniref:Uncharacterized protein n=1 Tax=Medicago truncatula TaxID=3880 RepID=A0A072TFX9_MEDTR|nr:hypothetical protein MTR_0302s0040 [Medicago truncatula]